MAYQTQTISYAQANRLMQDRGMPAAMTTNHNDARNVFAQGLYEPNLAQQESVDQLQNPEPDSDDELDHDAQIYQATGFQGMGTDPVFYTVEDESTLQHSNGNGTQRRSASPSPPLQPSPPASKGKSAQRSPDHQERPTLQAHAQSSTSLVPPQRAASTSLGSPFKDGQAVPNVLSASTSASSSAADLHVRKQASRISSKPPVSGVVHTQAIASAAHPGNPRGRTASNASISSVNKDDMLRKLQEALFSAQKAIKLYKREMREFEKESMEVNAELDRKEQQLAENERAYQQKLADLTSEIESLETRLETANLLTDDEANRIMALIANDTRQSERYSRSRFQEQLHARDEDPNMTMDELLAQQPVPHSWTARAEAKRRARAERLNSDLEAVRRQAAATANAPVSRHGSAPAELLSSNNASHVSVVPPPVPSKPSRERKGSFRKLLGFARNRSNSNASIQNGAQISPPVPGTFTHNSNHDFAPNVYPFTQPEAKPRESYDTTAQQMANPAFSTGQWGRSESMDTRNRPSLSNDNGATGIYMNDNVSQVAINGKKNKSKPPPAGRQRRGSTSRFFQILFPPHDPQAATLNRRNSGTKYVTAEKR